MNTLFELNEHLRRIVALNFPQPLWVSAEIAQIDESRGHSYLELVQKEEGGDIRAQAQAVIWAGDFRRMLSKYGMPLRSILREGLELKMQVRPEFHERYGLKLQIIDIDPDYTLGQLDLQRRQTVQALRDLDLFDRNRALPLPLVLQRIAVISSETAAGLQDFLRQLQDNRLGYQFDLKIFAASVQGDNAGAEMMRALSAIALAPERFDCIVIVRGGGSRLDLAAFDGLELCRAVAGLPLPVLAGIGHDVDETVLDLVAHRSLKTPTAVAEFILQHDAMFESDVSRVKEQIRLLAVNFLRIRHLQLEQSAAETRWAARQCLRQAQFQLTVLQQQVPQLSRQFLQRRLHALEQVQAYCDAVSPEAVLRRGFSLTTKNGRAVSSLSDISPGDILETRVRDGVIVSKVGV